MLADESISLHRQLGLLILLAALGHTAAAMTAYIQEVQYVIYPLITIPLINNMNYLRVSHARLWVNIWYLTTLKHQPSSVPFGSAVWETPNRISSTSVIIHLLASPFFAFCRGTSSRIQEWGTRAYITYLQARQQSQVNSHLHIENHLIQIIHNFILISSFRQDC